MTESPTRHIIAVYAGSFDPVTHGHLDVIRRASLLFNELIVGIGHNPAKEETFTQEERNDLLAPHVAGMSNVRLAIYDGLTIDFVRRCQARVIVRGIRDISDLSSELMQANINLIIGQVETIFLPTTDQHVLTSSTYVKQIYQLGGADSRRIERLVPRNVAEALANKLGNGRNRAENQS